MWCLGCYGAVVVATCATGGAAFGFNEVLSAVPLAGLRDAAGPAWDAFRTQVTDASSSFEALKPADLVSSFSAAVGKEAAGFDTAATVARLQDRVVANTVGQLEPESYSIAVAASAVATCGVTLPVISTLASAERERRLREAVEVPAEEETPYAGGADSYDPVAADAFYSKRPGLVIERLVGLLQATASFQLQLLLDWRFGNLEKNEKIRAAEALALANELGPTFIKLGQALSIRTDLIPEAYALELRQLQDAVPPFPDAQAFAILKREFEVESLDEIFESITDRPIASASIGQVYRATLKPGKYEVRDRDDRLGEVSRVALKVQRPNVLAEIALDLYLLRLLTPLQVRVSNAVSKLATDQSDIDVALALVDEWGRGFVNEVDYDAEARNTVRFSKAMRDRGLGAVVAPRVVDELLRKNVLVTEWIEGTRLDTSASPDVPRLCGVAINAYLTMLLDTGTLHCDPHPGNLLRTQDGRLCILDWGMTLEVPKDLQYALLEFIAHINTENLDAVPQDFVNLGFTPPDKLDKVASSGVTDGLAFMLRQLSGGGGPKKIQERMKAEFIERYGDVSDAELRERARAEMVQRMEDQLIQEGVDVRGVSSVMEEMSRRNRELFQLPTWVLYVVRAFSTLEGIGLSVDEEYSIISECYPYLARRLFKDESPRARKALYAMLYGREAAPTASLDGALLNNHHGADADGIDYEKFAEMVEGFASYSTATSGAGLAIEATAASTASAASTDAQRELAAVLFDANGNYVQDLLLDESARVLDATFRTTLASALEATPFIDHAPKKTSAASSSSRSSSNGPVRLAGDGSADDDKNNNPVRTAISSLRRLPVPARVALLPLTGGVEAAAAFANALYPLVAPSEADTKTIKSIQRITQSLQPQQPPSNLGTNDKGARLPAPAPTAAPSFEDAFQTLAKLAPNGDARELATPETLRTASLIARRFGATLLERSAQRAAPLAALEKPRPNHPEDTLAAQAARAISSGARQAARVVRPPRAAAPNAGGGDPPPHEPTTPARKKLLA